MDAVYEETYKGHVIEIIPDEDTQSPDEWGNDELFLVHYHRQFYVRRDDIVTEQNLAELFRNDGKNEDEYGEVIWDGFDDYHIFWLSSYIHSGVSLHMGKDFVHPFDQAGWDTSRCGAVLVKKVKENGWEDREKAYKAAESLVEGWNQYLSGEVYGFVIDGPVCEDSCWGFYGDYETSGCLLEARSSIDYDIQQAKTKHIEQLKKWIVNHVPLEKRAPMPTF